MKRIWRNKAFYLFGILSLVIGVSVLLSYSLLKTKLITSNKAYESTSIRELDAIERSKPYLSQEQINKTVYVIVIDPLIKDKPDSQIRLSTYLKDKRRVWNDPIELTNRLIATFKEVSNNRVNFKLFEDKIVTSDTFPIKENGFSFDLNTFENCLAGKGESSFCSMLTDYPKLINQYNICDLVNKGQVDEVWLWGYSGFGFRESRLMGKEAFHYNGEVVSNTTCNKLVPIMGFNTSVGEDNALHSFGHRAESTMAQMYRGWNQNRLKTRWDAFGMDKYRSPYFNYSGCGNIHIAPNSLQHYDYTNNNSFVATVCDDFKDYFLFSSNKILEKKTSGEISLYPSVNCKFQSWSCTHQSYMKWWFSSLPQFTGVGFDGVLNDWMSYIVDPNLALIHRATVEKKECSDNIKQSTCDPALCTWNNSCRRCEQKDKQMKLAEVCDNYCSQFNNNPQGCSESIERGFGCVWNQNCGLCITEKESQTNTTQECPHNTNKTVLFSGKVRIDYIGDGPESLNIILEESRDNQKTWYKKAEKIIESPERNISYGYAIYEDTPTYDGIGLVEGAVYRIIPQTYDGGKWNKRSPSYIYENCNSLSSNQGDNSSLLTSSQCIFHSKGSVDLRIFAYDCATITDKNSCESKTCKWYQCANKGKGSCNKATVPEIEVCPPPVVSGGDWMRCDNASRSCDDFCTSKGLRCQSAKEIEVDAPMLYGECSQNGSISYQAYSFHSVCNLTYNTSCYCSPLPSPTPTIAPTKAPPVVSNGEWMRCDNLSRSCSEFCKSKGLVCQGAREVEVGFPLTYGECWQETSIAYKGGFFSNVCKPTFNTSCYCSPKSDPILEFKGKPMQN